MYESRIDEVLTQAVKENMVNWTSLKLKTCASEDTFERVKRQPKDGSKYLQTTCVAPV